MTVREALAGAAARLAAAGVREPAWDAALLLRHVLACDAATLIVREPLALAPGERERFERLVDERARRRPLQHITGSQAFWRHEFLVTPDVLVPRPETELLVEAALELLRERPSPVVVDAGTGSGCIALSLAAERPDAEVHATDVSAPALAVAGENARRLGLERRVLFHEGDLLEPLAGMAGRVALVAANPPYVGAGEWDALAPEVREHEPALALLAPGDRGAIYRRLVPQAARLLQAEGHLLLEIGSGMEPDVTALCRAGGLPVLRVIADLQGIPRCVVAQRPAEPPLTP